MISAALAAEHSREMLEAARAAYPVRSIRHRTRPGTRPGTRPARGRALAAMLRSR